MLIDQETQTRILTSLRWLVADARYRSDDCRQNTEEGSGGGYSPNLIKAIDLLNELESYALTGGQPETAPCSYTEQQCKDVAVIVGLTEDDGTACFHYYNSQRWVKANGQPVGDLKSLLVNWKNDRYRFGDGKPPAKRVGTDGLTPRQRHIKETGK